MRHRSRSLCLGHCALLAAAACGPPAQAYTVSISPGSPRAIYLQVGVGSFTGGNYNSGGQPANNPTINTVSVTVPTAAVGSGAAQAMASNTGATSSFLDGFAFCNTGELYVGGFYRLTSSGTGTATLTANSSTALNNGSGSTIPFTQITWVSSGNGDTGTQPFASGTFTGNASQSIGGISSNQWAESCMTFSYLNTAVRAAGTYTGQVTYTLTAP